MTAHLIRVALLLLLSGCTHALPRTDLALCAADSFGVILCPNGRVRP